MPDYSKSPLLKTNANELRRKNDDPSPLLRRKLRVRAVGEFFGFDVSGGDFDLELTENEIYHTDSIYVDGSDRAHRMDISLEIHRRVGRYEYLPQMRVTFYQPVYGGARSGFAAGTADGTWTGWNYWNRSQHSAWTCEVTFISS